MEQIQKLPTQAQFRRALKAVNDAGLTVYGVDVARCIVVTQPSNKEEAKLKSDWRDDEG